MGNGVRLATAYVSIEADVTSLEEQITDSLNKAGKQAKPAGEKIGKDIRDGAKSSAKDAGKEIGGAILDGVRQGAKDAGVDLDKVLVDAAGRAGAAAGKKIHDAIEGSFAGPALRGIQNHINEITDFTRTATDRVRDLDDAFVALGGNNEQLLNGLKQAGDWLIHGDIKDVGTAFSQMSTALKSLSLSNVKEGLKSLASKDIAGTLTNVSTALSAIGQNQAADTVSNFGKTLSNYQTEFSAAKTNIDGMVTALGAIAPAASAALGPYSALAAISFTGGEELAKLWAHHEDAKNSKWFKDFNTKDSDWYRARGLPVPDPIRPVTGPGSVDTSAIPQTPESLQRAGGVILGAPGADRSVKTWQDLLGLLPQRGGSPGGSGPGGTAPGAAIAPSAFKGPGRAPEGGLQTNTIRANRALSAAFPEIGTIGGVRQDALKWHPQGLALDVMIPGQGGLNDPTTPEGLALGNRIWSWMGAHAQELGIDMGASLWQQKDHYNHIHLATTGGGYPSFDEGTKDPLDQDLTGNLHKGEMVIPKKAVDNAGGGPGVSAALNGQDQGGDDQLMENFARTMGYLPAAAATGGVAGTSSLAGLFNLGNQAVSGLIDTGASAAQTAVSAAVTAAAAGGTFGGAAAAGPAAGAAAGYGIQLGATELKRLSSYGFQLGAIWSDALVEQMFPFGAPRWLGYDYTQFLPQLDISQVGTTTAEKAVQAAMGQGKGQGPGDVPGVTQPVAGAQQPGAPVSPMTLPGLQNPGPPTPGLGSVPPGGAPPSAPSAPPPPQAPPASPGPFTPGQPSGSVLDQFRSQLGGAAAPPQNPLFGPTTGGGPTPPSFPGMLMPTTYDEGGVWPTGTVGMNMSGRPELVLPPDHTAAVLAASPSKTGRNGDTYYISGMSPADAMKEVARKQRLDMMRSTGRPTGI